MARAVPSARSDPTARGGPPTTGYTGYYFCEDRVRNQILAQVDSYSGGARDTWIMNRYRQWRLVSSGSGPLGSSQRMAHDTNRDKYVLFGGYTGSGVGRYGHTWEFDPVLETWSEKTPSPAPGARSNALIVYDAARQETVLYGGAASWGDTWTWNGTLWTQKSPATSPGVVADQDGCWDSANNVLLMHGGRSGLTPWGDTWQWNGTTWADRTPTARKPPGSRFPLVTYLSGIKRMLAFSGTDDVTVHGQTWEFDNADGVAAAQWAPRTQPSGDPGAVYSTVGHLYTADDEQLYMMTATAYGTVLGYHVYKNRWSTIQVPRSVPTARGVPA